MMIHVSVRLYTSGTYMDVEKKLNYMPLLTSAVVGRQRADVKLR